MAKEPREQQETDADCVLLIRPKILVVLMHEVELDACLLCHRRGEAGI